MIKVWPLAFSGSKKTIFRHSLLWVIVYLVYSFVLSFSSGNLYRHLLVNLLNVPMYMIAYYLLRYLQLPYLLNKGKTVFFILSFLGSSLFLAAVYFKLYQFFFVPVEKQISIFSFFSLGYYLLKTFRFYSPAMALLAWESHHEGRIESIRIQQLEKEKIANELKFLKAQINPHFLFNTLNNLYSYVVMESPKAPDMILRLSGILDYVLYKSQNKVVSLNEEVDTIENFLELEKIRYGERLQIDFKTGGNLSLSISPLILLSIVENAFKHGASGDIGTPQIKIDIKEQNGTICCDVWNTKSEHKGELNDAYKEGIGLSNIKRQLNLIYAERHQLMIDDGATSFNISLKIKPV